MKGIAAVAFPFNIIERHKGVFPKDFISWLPHNLHIFAEFCTRAKAEKKLGKKRSSAKMIIELIRANPRIRKEKGAVYKLDNNHTAYLSRLCMLAHPETNGLFETRERK